MKPLIIGSRGSPLALAQVALIKSLLPSVPVETVIIKTSGDKFLDVALAAAGGKGLFTKEIEDQLLAGTIQVAVHSLKDLPTDLPAGLTLAAVPASPAAPLVPGPAGFVALAPRFPWQPASDASSNAAPANKPTEMNSRRV